MLAPVGAAVRKTLMSKGCQIYRPTHLENALMRSVFEDWFSHDIERFAQLYAANRAVLIGLARDQSAANMAARHYISSTPAA